MLMPNTSDVSKNIRCLGKVVPCEKKDSPRKDFLPAKNP